MYEQYRHEINPIKNVKCLKSPQKEIVSDSIFLAPWLMYLLLESSMLSRWWLYGNL